MSKRRASSQSRGLLRSSGEMLAAAAEMLKLHTPSHVYSMNSIESKLALVDFLWTGDYRSEAGRFSAANPSLIGLFQEQSVDESIARPDNLMRSLGSAFPRFENVLQHLFRSRSMRSVPFETAALSIEFLHYTVPRVAWDAVAQLSRAVMCRSWTEELCELAMTRDPGPQYLVAMGVYLPLCLTIT